MLTVLSKVRTVVSCGKVTVLLAKVSLLPSKPKAKQGVLSESTFLVIESAVTAFPLASATVGTRTASPSSPSTRLKSSKPVVVEMLSPSSVKVNAVAFSPSTVK